MDEQQLIAAAQRGSLDAFNELVLAYQDRVYNLAYRILGDPAAAEDVTQEAFIAAYRTLNTFRGGSFLSWLLRTAANRCYDELRRQKRRPTVSWGPSANWTKSQPVPGQRRANPRRGRAAGRTFRFPPGRDSDPPSRPARCPGPVRRGGDGLRADRPHAGSSSGDHQIPSGAGTGPPAGPAGSAGGTSPAPIV